MTRVLGLSLYGSQAASHRIRLSQYRTPLLQHGIHLEIYSLLDNPYLLRSFRGRPPSLLALFNSYVRRINQLARSHCFDLAIVHCELFPFLPSWFELSMLKLPYIYDLDDAFYLKYRTGSKRLLFPFLGNKFDRFFSSAVAVTAGNSVLEAYARRHNNQVFFLPSVVDTTHYLPLAPLSLPSSNLFTIGWIGSPSTSPFLDMLVEPLQMLALEYPVRFLVIGGHSPSIPGVQVIEHPWSLLNEVSLIQQFDVGVMPLPDSDWARGKCAFKLIQYMACAVPVIASPIGANNDVVNTSCGFLASTTAEWLSAFRRIASDPLLRQRLGSAARQRVQQRYSLNAAAPILTSVIQQFSPFSE